MPMRIVDGTAINPKGMAEVRLGDGTVLWSGGADYTVLADFEDYSTQSGLESDWSISTSPTKWQLQSTGALQGSQNIRSEYSFSQTANDALDTPWGATYSGCVAATNTDGSPGILVQNQVATSSGHFDDCYWVQLDIRDDHLTVYRRSGGTTAETVAETSGSLSTGDYRIELELDDATDEVQGRVFDFGDPFDATPIIETPWAQPGTILTGGHFGFASGRSADANHVVADYVRSH